MWIDYYKLADWELVKEVVVGGLEWVGFSKVNTRKLLCISSQKTTIIDSFQAKSLRVAANMMKKPRLHTAMNCPMKKLA